jgi:hypothetical protein
LGAALVTYFQPLLLPSPSSSFENLSYRPYKGLAREVGIALDGAHRAWRGGRMCGVLDGMVLRRRGVA